MNDLSIHERITPTKVEKAVKAQTDFAALVNVSKQKWPPRHRAYFGSLEVRSPRPGEAYSDNGCGDCGGSFYAAAVNDLRGSAHADLPVDSSPTRPASLSSSSLLHHSSKVGAVCVDAPV